MQLKYHDGDDDGDDAVAECLGAVFVHAATLARTTARCPLSKDSGAGRRAASDSQSLFTGTNAAFSSARATGICTGMIKASIKGSATKFSVITGVPV